MNDWIRALESVTEGDTVPPGYMRLDQLRRLLSRTKHPLCLSHTKDMLRALVEKGLADRASFKIKTESGWYRHAPHWKLKKKK